MSILQRTLFSASFAALLCWSSSACLAAAAATDISIGPVGGIVADASGNVYFSSKNIVYRLDNSGTLTRFAGNGTPGFAGDGGPAPQALVDFPFTDYPLFQIDPIDFGEVVAGLAVDRSGNVYIADVSNERIRKVDRSGVITTVRVQDGGPGVAIDPSGNLYTAGGGELVRVSPQGVSATLASPNCGPGFLGPGLCGAQEIAVDAQGVAFVPDGYCRVRRIDSSTITTVAGADTQQDLTHGNAFTCGYSGDGGPATKAALSNSPFGVALDGHGNLYIADTGNHCIRKVDAAGTINTFAGTCTHAGYAGDGGPAAKALLNNPHSVFVDAGGNIYIADTGNYLVRKITPDGVITTIAGNGGAEASAVVPAATFASSGTIGPGFTGAWYDPNQSGQGLLIEVLDGGGIYAMWFAFAPDGTQAWFGGVGTYSGNTATIAQVQQPLGGRWIPNFDPRQIVKQQWGSFTFTFSDCNHGRVDFNSGLGYGTGHMDLTRLTQPAGLGCP